MLIPPGFLPSVFWSVCLFVCLFVCFETICCLVPSCSAPALLMPYRNSLTPELTAQHWCFRQLLWNLVLKALHVPVCPQHTVQLSSEVPAWAMKEVLAWGCAWGNKPCSSAALVGSSRSCSWLWSYLCVNTFEGISLTFTMQHRHTFKLYIIRDGISIWTCL